MQRPRFNFGRKKKREIHAVINENSGKGKGRKEERDIIMGMWVKAFGDDQYPQSSDIAVHRTHSLTELDKAKDEIRDECPKYVLVFGGDGTIQKLLGEEDGLLEHLISGEHPTKFLFYGGGSTDTIKNELKVIGRDPIAVTTAIIEKIRAGLKLDTIHRNILKINDKHGFIYGAGLPATLLEKYNAKTPKGIWRIVKIAFWWFFAEIFRLLPFWKKHTVAQRVPIAHEFWRENLETEKMEFIRSGVGNRSAVVASSLRQVGMGCKLTYRAEAKVKHFHAILSGLGFWGSVRRLLAMFRGVPLTGPVEDEVAAKVVLKYGEPVQHTIDGELFSEDDMTDTVTIECGPRLEIVRG